MVNILTLLPFNYFIKLQDGYGRLFYLLKILRLLKGFKIVNVATIMHFLKHLYQKRMNKLIKDDPE